MDKDTFLSKIQELGTLEDEVQRRTILAEISDEVSKVYDDKHNLEESNTKYIQDNETLREANMKLFLRVGTNKSETKNEDLGLPKAEPEKRKFEDLFNEKGELK